MTTSGVSFFECEKEVNESWSKIKPYQEDLKRILEQGGPQSEIDITVLMIIGTAVFQKLIVDDLADELFIEAPEA